MADIGVMIADCLREIEQSADCVEKDRFDHSEFQGVRYLARTISHKTASITSGSGSQARIEGIHQSPNNATSADRAVVTGARRPSLSRSIPTVISSSCDSSMPLLYKFVLARRPRRNA